MPGDDFLSLGTPTNSPGRTHPIERRLQHNVPTRVNPARFTWFRGLRGEVQAANSAKRGLHPRWSAYPTALTVGYARQEE